MPAPGLFRLLCAMLVSTLAVAHADEIEVREASLAQTEEGIVLSADFAFELNARLAEALASGVPLYFVVEFELSRTRWWWFNEKTASRRMQRRLSYHALSRQYRLATGLLQQSFGSLAEALAVLGRVRNWVVLERDTPLADALYDAAVRMRLDTALLPKPFQISALTSRELHLESPWKRFSWRPGAPVPVEAREPREAGAQ